MKSLLILIAFNLHVALIADAAKFVNLTRLGYSGTIALFVVPRERVAHKLNEINTLHGCSQGRPTLNLPNSPILPDLLEPDEHVIGISVGNLSSRSFMNTLSASTACKYTLHAPTVQFFVPFLTGPDADDVPHFKLPLISFVSTEKPFLNPNIAVPVTQVDELVIGKYGVSMKNGEEYFSVSWKEGECYFKHDLDKGVDDYADEFMLPLHHELDFSVCDPSDVQNVDLCKSHAGEMDCILARNGLNACEYWRPMESIRKCKLKSYTLESISAWFQAQSLLSEDNTSPVIFEMMHETDFSANIKVPCIHF